MSNRFTKVNVKVGLVQGFYWMASCVFVSFLVRLLNGYGYSDYESGVALSVSAFAALTVQPLLGIVADHTKSVGRLLVVCFMVSCLGAFSILFINQNRIATYAVIFVIFGAFRSLIYIIDLWSVRVGEGDPSFSYGFTRSFGALMYALSALVYGYAIDIFGTRIIIPCFIVMSTIALVMVALAPKPSDAEVDGDAAEKLIRGFVRSLGRLLRNKHYMMLLLCYTLVEISCLPGQNYLTRKFEVLGAGEVFTGTSLLVMALLQLPVLNRMDSLKKRFKPKSLVWISLLGLLLRTVILGFSSTAIGTVCAFITEPFAFGLYIGAILLYMLHYLPHSLHFFGMTLYAAITGGLGGIVGNYFAGLLSERHGVLVMLRVMTIPALLGFAIFTICMILWRGEEDS